MLIETTVVNPGCVLIIVENNSVPFDRRVWYEATALRDAGWQVIVVCPVDASVYAKTNRNNGFGTGELLEEVTIYRFPLTFADGGKIAFIKEYLSAFWFITLLSWQAWKKHRFDILHVCNPPDIFFPISLFYRLLGVKNIFDHHDLFPEMVKWRYHGLPGRVFYYLSCIFEYLSFHFADIVISTNESYKQIAQKRGKLQPDRIVVVRNGPKVSEFVPSDPVAELRSGFTHNVCFVGIMGEDDGVIELIDVIRQVVHGFKREDILFTIVGDGPMKTLAETRVKEWNISKFVKMPGLVKNDVLLKQYLSSADLFVSPEPLTPMNDISTFIKIGEYMAMGKPIVAFDLKESRFTAQEAAYYVKPGDIHGFAEAIIEIIDNPVRRARMGEIGRNRIVNLLSWDRQQRNLHVAYSAARSEQD
jgi:glycosyltransferase involved in cell wall biosynthesis